LIAAPVLRRDGDDDADHDQADHDAGEQIGAAALVDDAEDREQQDGRAEGLVQHGRADRGVRGVGDVPDAGFLDLVPEDAPDREAAEHAADALRDDVRPAWPHGIRLVTGHRERHRRVDMATGHLADRVDHRHHGEAEGSRDREQLRAGERRSAVPPRARNSAGTEPAPRNTSTAVPTTSAPSF
jgi:hypothetical protein